MHMLSSHVKHMHTVIPYMLNTDDCDKPQD